jgi:chromosome segregation ATPase
MDPAAVILTVAAALAGGGLVAIYRARSERRKTLAETRHTEVQSQTSIVREAVQTAQGFTEIANSLVKPLQDRLNDTQRDLAEHQTATARLQERVGSLERLEAECREDRAALRRQLDLGRENRE